MVESMETEFLKLALMGSGGSEGVGKSNIAMRFINGEFKDYYYDPMIEDSYMKYNYMVDEEPISLEMDTVGHLAFIGSRKAYYQSNDGFVFVYSVTDK